MNTGGITIDLTTFNFTTTDSGVSEIALRNDHVCAIIDNGSVSCWGANVDGQMGIGSFSTRELIPVTAQLPAGRTATKIATGAFFSCAIMDNRSVVAGEPIITDNLESDLLVAQRADSEHFTFTNWRTATQISAGTYHACALLDNGA